MKKFSIASVLMGAVLLITSLVLPYVLTIVSFRNSPSIGIIGGADAPTLNLYRDNWLSSVHFPISLLGIAAIITGVISLIFKKSVCQSCTIKTSITALIISVASSIGFYCFLIYVFTTAIAGIISCFILLGVSVFLVIKYIISYITDKQYKRIIFDIGIIIIYFVPFLMLFGYLFDAIMGLFN